MRGLLTLLLLLVITCLGAVLWHNRPQAPVFTSPGEYYRLHLPIRWAENYLVAANPKETAFPQAKEVVTFWTKPEGSELAMPLLSIVALDLRTFRKIRKLVEDAPAHVPLATSAGMVFIGFFPESNPYLPGTRAAKRFARLQLTYDEAIDGFELLIP